MKKKASKLNKFFQQVRSGRKSAREELEDQIKKVVIYFKEQLKEQLEQDLIDQMEQFEKEQIENKEKLKIELIKYVE